MEHTWSLACWEGSNTTHCWWLLDKQLTSESAVGKHKLEKEKKNSDDTAVLASELFAFGNSESPFVQDGKMCGILWSPSETEHLKHIEPIAESSVWQPILLQSYLVCLWFLWSQSHPLKCCLFWLDSHIYSLLNHLIYLNTLSHKTLLLVQIQTLL